MRLRKLSFRRLLGAEQGRFRDQAYHSPVLVRANLKLQGCSSGEDAELYQRYGFTGECVHEDNKIPLLDDLGPIILSKWTHKLGVVLRDNCFVTESDTLGFDQMSRIL